MTEPPAAPTLPAAPTATPATSSGPLTPDVLPAAGSLGAGWRTRVEGLELEEGMGNGTAYQERDPVEIVETTVPMGCAVRSDSPVPENVLQSTYRHERTGGYAVALLMRFDSDEAATRFASIRRADLEACRDQPEDRYSGAPAPVRSVRGSTDRYVTAYQQVGEAAVWVSALQVDGPEVLTLDSDAAPTRLVRWRDLGLPVPRS